VTYLATRVLGERNQVGSLLMTAESKSKLEPGLELEPEPQPEPWGRGDFGVVPA
jgi:hypothetical protein